MTADGRELRIVVPRYGPSILGGSEALMRMVATRLTREGWRVEVWTSCAYSEATWANVERPGIGDDEGVRVRRFRTATPRWPAGFAAASRVFFRVPRALRLERAWLAAQGPWMPSLVRALRDAPAMPTIFVPYLYHPTLSGIHACAGVRILQPAAHDERPLRLRAVGAAVQAADAIWYGSPEEQALLERVHPVAAARMASVGTVGVDAPAGVDAGAFSRRLRFEGPYLLYAGRATRGKGLEVLDSAIDVLRRTHPDARLVLAGDDGHRSDAQRGIVAVGRLPKEGLWEALAGAVALVVPSALESLSLVTLEAWAVGRPVLVNARSAVLAGHAARGGAVAWRDAGELAASAGRLLDSPEEAQRVGDEGRARVEREYTWDGVVERVGTLVDAPQIGRRVRRSTGRA